MTTFKMPVPARLGRCANAGARTLAACALMASAPVATGTQAAENNGLLLRIGYSAGGDTLTTAAFDDGSTDDLDAGAGGYAEIGLRLGLLGENLPTEITAGYHLNIISADNGDLRFDRVFGTAIQYLKLGNVRIGGGVYYAASADVELDSDIARAETSFDAAAGPALAANIALSDRLTLGARAVDIEFETDDGTVFDGSHVGAHLSLTF